MATTRTKKKAGAGKAAKAASAGARHAVTRAEWYELHYRIQQLEVTLDAVVEAVCQLQRLSSTRATVVVLPTPRRIPQPQHVPYSADGEYRRSFSER